MLQFFQRIPCFLLSTGYTLVEIEEEATPLAPGISNTTMAFGAVLVLMGCVLTIGMALVYMGSCYKCKRRIKQLQDNQGGVRGWNLRRLRDTVTDMELQQTEQIPMDL